MFYNCIFSFRYDCYMSLSFIYFQGARESWSDDEPWLDRRWVVIGELLADMTRLNRSEIMPTTHHICTHLCQCMVMVPPAPPESNKYFKIFTAYIYITHLDRCIKLRIYIRNQNIINNSIIGK